jgi:hypothetical protein
VPTQLIWWTGILLELVIAFRAVRGRLLSKFPYFYAFVFSVLIAEIPSYLIYTLDRAAYPGWFWATDFLSLLLGCGIILEILRHVLSPYHGAEKFARTLGLVVFGAVFCFALGYSLIASGASVIERTHFELERDFLAVQALFIFAALGVVAYYRIPVGRNLKGIVLGYGLCIGASLVSFALRSFIGAGFDLWMSAEPFSYDVSLLIWAVALWSYHPNPEPSQSIRVEADYELLAARTRKALGATRSYLGRAARL